MPYFDKERKTSIGGLVPDACLWLSPPWLYMMFSLALFIVALIVCGCFVFGHCFAMQYFVPFLVLQSLYLDRHLDTMCL